MLNFTSRKVHEYRIVSGKGAHLKNPLLHYSYRSLTQHLDKMNLYSSLESQQRFNEGLRLEGLNMLLCLFVKPAVYFFHRYILLGGFLDGRPGFLISLFTGIGYFFIYAKVWELGRKKRN
jgi:hypothetical protein